MSSSNPSLIKRLFGASGIQKSSSSSSTSSTSKSSSKSTSSTKIIMSSAINIQVLPAQHMTTTATTHTSHIVINQLTALSGGSTAQVEITGPGSDPRTNKIWAGDEVPMMIRGMVPALVGEEQLSLEEMERMGIRPEGRWVKVGETTTVRKLVGKTVQAQRKKVEWKDQVEGKRGEKDKSKMLLASKEVAGEKKKALPYLKSKIIEDDKGKSKMLLASKEDEKKKDLPYLKSKNVEDDKSKSKMLLASKEDEKKKALPCLKSKIIEDDKGKSKSKMLLASKEDEKKKALPYLKSKNVEDDKGKSKMPLASKEEFGDEKKKALSYSKNKNIEDDKSKSKGKGKEPDIGKPKKYNML